MQRVPKGKICAQPTALAGVFLVLGGQYIGRGCFRKIEPVRGPHPDSLPEGEGELMDRLVDLRRRVSLHGNAMTGLLSQRPK